jgi:opacity protein-like surface antigen
VRGWCQVVETIACAVLVMASSRAACAQGRIDGPPGRFEIAAGLARGGASMLGSRDAALTGAAGSPYRLFSTSTELSGATGFEVRLSRRVARLIQAEFSGRYAKPVLGTSITNDRESPEAAIVASESTTEYTIGAGGLVYIPRLRIERRVLPFVTGGGGYLRQLHEGAALVQTGRTYYAGAGASIPFATGRPGAHVAQIGLRFDGRAIVRTGGIAVDGRAHVATAVGASLFVRF